MAGMLPGVEAARRRKCHQSSESLPWTTSYGGFSMRRSSLTSASFMRKYPAKQALFDESELGGEAREAKKRLDARLQHRWKSQSKRSSSEHAKEETKKLKWLKLKWKSSEEEECAVCLEQVKWEGESIMHLPCVHKFHTECLVPWLETNANCPCCRMAIH
ncbi:E3 ubiquitin-protein ligase SIRP1-like isoform X4 [Primulina tabacum]|uniref:E3 ubiquitin-protein ligase SIRP1-like isoform X4 n=1 Tax=Primulina tabacum TaxID=48773 RepID=UPI003F5940A2